MTAESAPPANPIDEGDQCPKCHEAEMEFRRRGECTCHIRPPCASCMEAELECPKCFWNPEDDLEDA